jgi:hypothetical protein
VRVQAQKDEITRSVPIGWTDGLVDNPKNIDPDKTTSHMMEVVSMGQ